MASCEGLGLGLTKRLETPDESIVRVRVRARVRVGKLPRARVTRVDESILLQPDTRVRARVRTGRVHFTTTYLTPPRVRVRVRARVRVGKLPRARIRVGKLPMARVTRVDKSILLQLGLALGLGLGTRVDESILPDV